MSATLSGASDIKHRRQEIHDTLAAMAKAAELSNKGRFTPEQRGQINALREEDKNLKAELDALEGDAEILASIAETGRELGQSAGRKVDPRAGEAHEKELLEAKKDQGFGGFGQFLQSVAAAAYQPHAADKRLKWTVDKQSLAVASGMSESVPSDGGFLVQYDFVTEILRRMYSIGQIMSQIRKIEVGTNANGIKIPAIDETSRATGSRWGGVQAYWQAEASSATPSKPKLRLMELDLKKLIGLVYATDELLQDAAALESVINQALPEELNFMAEDSIFNGTGGGMPQGIVNANALITIAKETGQAAATIVFENIQKMWARMYAPSRRNAIWVIDQSCEPQLNSMAINVGTGGLPVYMPPGAFASGLVGAPSTRNDGAGAGGGLGGTAGTFNTSGTLMGRPVFTYEYGAALGSVGDIMLVDPTQYVGITKGGLQAAQSMHVKFLTDEMTYRFTYRFDGQPIWHAALTPKSGSSTWSPYVTLAAR